MEIIDLNKTNKTLNVEDMKYSLIFYREWKMQKEDIGKIHANSFDFLLAMARIMENTVSYRIVRHEKENNDKRDVILVENKNWSKLIVYRHEDVAWYYKRPVLLFADNCNELFLYYYSGITDKVYVTPIDYITLGKIQDNAILVYEVFEIAKRIFEWKDGIATTVEFDDIKIHIREEAF